MIRKVTRKQVFQTKRFMNYSPAALRKVHVRLPDCLSQQVMCKKMKLFNLVRLKSRTKLNIFKDNSFKSSFSHVLCS